MLLTHCLPATLCVLVVFALFLANEPARTAPASAAKTTRAIYSVRGGAAKDLGISLATSFKAENGFQVVVDEGSGSLLVSGPEALVNEALKILERIDRPARTVHVE